MQEKVTEMLQYENESLKMENEGELCCRVDNNSADQYRLRKYDNEEKSLFEEAGKEGRYDDGTILS